jgi:hypothetical protein
MDSEQTQQALEVKAKYEEVGQNYRKFLDWREKIIGGYVAIVGALGLGYHQSEGHPGFQSILLCAAALTSFAFWTLNMRNSKFTVTCLVAGRKLEQGGDGIYTEMKALRRTGRLTHGLAVNLLVSGVVAGSAFGLWTIRACWLKKQYLCSIGVCASLFVFLVLLAEVLGDPDPNRPEKQ